MERVISLERVVTRITFCGRQEGKPEKGHEGSRNCNAEMTRKIAVDILPRRSLSQVAIITFPVLVRPSAEHGKCFRRWTRRARARPDPLAPLPRRFVRLRHCVRVCDRPL